MGQHQDLSTEDLVSSRPADRESADREPAVEREPASAAVEREPVQEPTGADTDLGPLVPDEQADGYRSRWDAIQAGFVDEPREAVAQADGLVAEVMRHLAETFADERGRLEGMWERGEQVGTEDLRVVLQRYRAFFNRLLSA